MLLFVEIALRLDIAGTPGDDAAVLVPLCPLDVAERSDVPLSDGVALPPPLLFCSCFLVFFGAICGVEACGVPARGMTEGVLVRRFIFGTRLPSSRTSGMTTSQ